LQQELGLVHIKVWFRILFSVNINPHCGKVYKEKVGGRKNEIVWIQMNYGPGLEWVQSRKTYSLSPSFPSSVSSSSSPVGIPGIAGPVAGPAGSYIGSKQSLISCSVGTD
jgi:hypothetical protein